MVQASAVNYAEKYANNRLGAGGPGQTAEGVIGGRNLTPVAINGRQPVANGAVVIPFPRQPDGPAASAENFRSLNSSQSLAAAWADLQERLHKPAQALTELRDHPRAAVYCREGERLAGSSRELVGLVEYLAVRLAGPEAPLDLLLARSQSRSLRELLQRLDVAPESRPDGGFALGAKQIKELLRIFHDTHGGAAFRWN